MDIEKFWDDLHYTKIKCPYCGNRLPSKNDDGVTPNHCLNLCTLTVGQARKFDELMHQAQMEIAQRKAVEKLISEQGGTGKR